ncbi:LysE family translocator [Pseudoroseicyclus sp. H15]
MSITPAELGLYAFAILLLFLTPGPVWVALLARALSGGFSAAWPLAVGVTLGDILWPLLAILGVSWVLSVYGDFLHALRIVASLIFLTMGVMIIRHAGQPLGANSRLTRPGRWAGFAAGVAVIIGNPKAILFYIGILPGFFDVGSLTWPDVAAICVVSFTIPLIGNLCLAVFIDRARRLLTSPRALVTTNRVAGGLLILVGLILPFI